MSTWLTPSVHSGYCLSVTISEKPSFTTQTTNCQLAFFRSTYHQLTSYYLFYVSHLSPLYCKTEWRNLVCVFSSVSPLLACGGCMINKLSNEWEGGGSAGFLWIEICKYRLFCHLLCNLGCLESNVSFFVPYLVAITCLLSNLHNCLCTKCWQVLAKYTNNLTSPCPSVAYSLRETALVNKFIERCEGEVYLNKYHIFSLTSGR